MRPRRAGPALLNDRTGNHASTRRILGPAIARARALRVRERGAAVAVGYAVNESGFEAMTARPLTARRLSGLDTRTARASPKRVLAARFAARVRRRPAAPPHGTT